MFGSAQADKGATQNGNINAFFPLKFHPLLPDILGMMKQATEIVINSTLVTDRYEAIFYEFVLDQWLHVVECGYVESLSQHRMQAVVDPRHDLSGLLFELNHVRVNPRMDNTLILTKLSRALEDSGVQINHPANRDDMALCFKPLGELSDIVRFFVNQQGQLTFLSSSVKLHVVEPIGPIPLR